MKNLDTQTINALVEILNQEARIYQELSKISKKKTNIIVEGRVNELESIVKLEQTLVLQMGRLETNRENLVENVAKQLKLDPAQVTISEIVKHLKDGEGERLKECQTQMVQVINDLKSANDLNSKLIKNSLDFINFSVNLLTSLDIGTNNYGNSGNVNNSKKRNFFDMKL